MESQAGLKLSKVPLALLQPYVEEVLELDFRRARKLFFDFSGNDVIWPVSPRLASLLSTFAITSDGLFVDSGTRFIFMVKDIVEQVTSLVILHFEGNSLTRILQLFDQYMDELIKALTKLSEDDSLVELKEDVPFRAETNSQQISLLGVSAARITSNDFLFWFRSPAAKEIKWAGAKHHPEDEDELFNESGSSEVPLRRSAP